MKNLKWALGIIGALVTIVLLVGCEREILPEEILFSATLTTEKDTFFAVGDTTGEIVLMAMNITPSKSITCTLVTDPSVDFLVKDRLGNVIYHHSQVWGLDTVCCRTIGMGPEYSYPVHTFWNQTDINGDKVPTGKYYIDAWIPEGPNHPEIYAPTKQIEVVSGYIEVILETDKTDYDEGEPVKVTISVVNHSGEDKELSFEDTQLADFTIYGYSRFLSMAVYHWSRHHEALQVPTTFTLEPYEEKTLLTYEWHQKDDYSKQLTAWWGFPYYAILAKMVGGLTHSEINNYSNWAAFDIHH